MKSVRRPATALATLLVLVVIQAVADPTGLLALVGFSGAQPRLDGGVWPLAPYLVFVPVLLAVAWWVSDPRGRSVLDPGGRLRARGAAGTGGDLPRHDLEPRTRPRGRPAT